MTAATLLAAPSSPPIARLWLFLHMNARTSTYFLKKGLDVLGVGVVCECLAIYLDALRFENVAPVLECMHVIAGRSKNCALLPTELKQSLSQARA